MTADVLRNSSDAYTSLEEPNKNFSGMRKLFVKAGNNGTMNGYLFFSRPFPLGSKIQSAKLRLYNGTTLEGGATVTAIKITEKWKSSKITWNNAPGVGGASVDGVPNAVESNGDIAPRTKFEFDITAMMQNVSDGGAFFGFRFTANNGKGEWFHGANSDNENIRPSLAIVWSEPKDAPDSLSPSSGNAVTEAKPLLTYEYESAAEETDLAAHQVQIFSDDEPPYDPSALIWDSGWVNTSVAEMNLANTSFPGIANDQTVYWTVRTRDDAGQESEWADQVGFVRKPMGVVMVVNPPVEPNNFVTENTPPLIWNFSNPQVKYQVMILDNENGLDVIWETGKVDGAENSVTPPEKVLQKNKEYTVVVRCWDGIQRERNGEFRVFAEAQRIFTTQFQNTVNPVTGLQAARVPPWHWTKLSWFRASVPDEFEIYADDVLMGKYPAAELISGGGYSAVMRAAPPRVETVWTVVPIVNGVGSRSNPTVTTKYKAESAVLCELDGTDPVMFLNWSREQTEDSNQTVHETMSGNTPVLISQSRGGVRGRFSGTLYGQSVPDMTSREEKRRFNRLRKNEGREVLLTLLDETYVCFIANSNVIGFADGSGEYYDVTFDYYEIVD